ncbi:MAG TPA: hypothetical protein PLQ78_01615 [Flavipsychrobacter sp.]|jgi:hypothetical protein|nr:hypothetical protein [Flavipsychrobacter sp.]
MRPFIILVFILISFIACNKKEPDQPTTQPSTTRMLNDTFMFVSNAKTIPIDIDGDSTSDFQLKFFNTFNQTNKSTNVSILPLTIGLQVPVETRTFYFIKDSIICTIDNNIFISTKINPCDSTDTKMNWMESITFAKLNNNDSLSFVSFHQELLIEKYYNTYSYGFCGYISSLYFIGNRIGTSFLQFKTSNGKKYQLNIRVIMPNLILDSITELK